MIRYLFILLLSYNYLFSYTTLDTDGITEDFEVDYFYDEYSIRTINDIVDKDKTDFTKTISNKFTLGYLDGSSWLKITLYNPKVSDTKNFIISLRESFFFKTNLYKYENNKWIEEKNGFLIPLKDRSIKENNPSFKVHINQNETKTFYIELGSKFSHFAEVKVFTPENFILSNKYMIMMYMFYFGGLFIIFLFILFLFITIKDNIYGYYALLVLFTLIFVFVLSGSHLYTPLAKYTYLLHTSAPILMIFLILFSTSFLETDKYAKNISNILYTLIVIFISLSVLMNIDMRLWYKFITIFASLTFIVLFYTSLVSWINGSKQAKYYIIILSIYSAVMATFTSMVNTWLPYTDFTRHGFLFASFFEVLFFSLVLANRFQNIQIDTINTQKELLKSKTKNTKTLEKEVKQRTKEISLLLKEVHHRVKNNFQIIIGLLWMESEKLQDENKEKLVFLELGNKIKAMSTVHQLLYEADDLSHIDSNVYLTNIIEDSLNIHQRSNLDISYKIDSFELNMNHAIILGVVLNEVLNNSIKHHKKTYTCKVDINFTKQDNLLTLSIKDNGDGFTHTTDLNSSGLGLKIVEQFCKKISDANYSYTNNKGSLFELKFDILSS